MKERRVEVTSRKPIEVIWLKNSKHTNCLNVKLSRINVTTLVI